MEMHPLMDILKQYLVVIVVHLSDFQLVQLQDYILIMMVVVLVFHLQMNLVIFYKLIKVKLNFIEMQNLLLLH